MGFAEVGKKASSRQLISGEQTTSGRDAQLIAHPPHCWAILFSFFFCNFTICFWGFPHINCRVEEDFHQFRPFIKKESCRIIRKEKMRQIDDHEVFLFAIMSKYGHRHGHCPRR